MQVPLIRLQCGVNSYDWGKQGKGSAAAKFAAATHNDFNIQEDKPYAEACPYLFQFDNLLTIGVSYGWARIPQIHLRTF